MSADKPYIAKGSYSDKSREPVLPKPAGQTVEAKAVPNARGVFDVLFSIGEFAFKLIVPTKLNAPVEIEIKRGGQAVTVRREKTGFEPVFEAGTSEADMKAAENFYFDDVPNDIFNQAARVADACSGTLVKLEALESFTLKV